MNSNRPGERPAPGDPLLRPDDELVLLLSSGGAGFDSCLGRLCNPAADTVIRVSYGGTGGHVADEWAEAFHEVPSQSLEVVASSGGTKHPADHEGHLVEVNPGDLTGLGVRLSGALERCAASEGDSTLCFDSLTVALQYADRQVIFQFLHTLSGLVRQAGTQAHFHLDPDAVDEQSVATLKTLFDTVVTVDDDGDVSVQSK